MGPLVFIIYKNNSSVSHATFSLSFAKDTNLLISYGDITVLINKLHRNLQNYSEWFKANKLYLNILKIDMNNKNRTGVLKTYFPSGWIDGKLGWTELIKHICKNMTKIHWNHKIRHFVH